MNKWAKILQIAVTTIRQAEAKTQTILMFDERDESLD
jgi:hypothetical protein